MKISIKTGKFATLLFLLIAIGGCTDDFISENRNVNAITSISLSEMPYVFNKAVSSATINATYYETTQNYFADIYSQYFAKAVSTERYNMNSAYTARMYLVSYVHVGAQLKTILKSADPNSGEYALASIMWVYTFHRLTDVLGPIPYFDALEESDATSYRYDKMSDIYADFFERLTTSVATLQKLNASTPIFGGKDNIYAGNASRWIKFANSLKLRLALRISKVDGATAKKRAEEAVASGVLEDNADNASVLRAAAGTDYNGLAYIAGWYASSMSSTMKSYLVGYNDPRLPVFFQPNFASGKYVSRRNGMSASDLNLAANASAQQSNIGSYWITYSSSTAYTNNITARQHVLSAAESYFLRSEGALNGWAMGGSAKDLYEKGIGVSLRQWGIANETTIAGYTSSANLPAAPQDYYNSPAVSTTPVKWAATETLQRKQIGTQKWLAVFPDGWEAWAEFRRTGYPDLYDLMTSENPDLPVGTFAKRLTYPNTEYTSNLEALNAGLVLLGGPDKASVKLWWDVD
jgi:hypothetical protein